MQKQERKWSLTLANQYQWGNYWLKNVLFTNKQKKKKKKKGKKERKKEGTFIYLILKTNYDTM